MAMYMPRAHLLPLLTRDATFANLWSGVITVWRIYQSSIPAACHLHASLLELGNANYPCFQNWPHQAFEVGFCPDVIALLSGIWCSQMAHLKGENMLIVDTAASSWKANWEGPGWEWEGTSPQWLVPSRCRMLRDSPRWHQDWFSYRHHPQVWSRAFGSTERDVLFYSLH